ncbi:hypothetical protein SDJN02_05635, partial [Cucurbita argyrosperma subsp. argyrosperma]
MRVPDPPGTLNELPASSFQAFIFFGKAFLLFAIPDQGFPESLCFMFGMMKFAALEDKEMIT